MSLAEQPLLDALDGLAYVVDGEGVVLTVGQPSWDVFATAAGDDRSLASAVVGHAVLHGAMTGDEVRSAYRLIHRRVMEGSHGHVGFKYPAASRRTSDA